MGRVIDIRFLYTDMQKAQEELGYDSHRDFVRAMFLTKHNVIIEDFSKLKFTYLKAGIIVKGEIGKGLVWK